MGKETARAIENPIQILEGDLYAAFEGKVFKYAVAEAKWKKLQYCQQTQCCGN